jgi:hypothetical protein
MDLTHIRPSALVECLVVILQVAGLAGLCLSRLAPTRSLANGGRAMLILAMIGLGIAGACCGRNDSGMGLFAGGTMTVLLIGIIAGGCPTETARTTAVHDVAETTALA